MKKFLVLSLVFFSANAVASVLPKGTTMLYTPEVKIVSAEAVTTSSCEFCEDIREMTKVNLVATLNGCADGFVLPRTQELFFGGDYIRAFEQSGRVTLALAPIGLWNEDSALIKCIAIPQEAFSVYIDGFYAVDKIDLDIQIIPEK